MVEDPAIDCLWICGPNHKRIENMEEIVAALSRDIKVAPAAEIYTIPPDCPVYNVTYVYVYSSTPDVVYVGYTPGYLWSFPYYGVPVYGTGWYYPGYYNQHYRRYDPVAQVAASEVNLAVQLARAGKKVGLLDSDVYGPSIPKMLGIDLLG